MENETFFYEITRKEKKSRNDAAMKQFLRFLPIAACLGVLQAITEGAFDPTLAGQYIFFWIVLAGVTFLAIASNRVYPHPERRYRLEVDGITISKGKKVQKYVWGEFDSFFIHKYPIESESQATQAAVRNKNQAIVDAVQSFGKQVSKTQGEVFYLVRKPRGLWRLAKRFVLVYGEPENSSEVERYLASYIPERKMKTMDELGLMFYEFK